MKTYKCVSSLISPTSFRKIANTNELFFLPWFKINSNSQIWLVWCCRKKHCAQPEPKVYLQAGQVTSRCRVCIVKVELSPAGLLCRSDGMVKTALESREQGFLKLRNIQITFKGKILSWTPSYRVNPIIYINIQLCVSHTSYLFLSHSSFYS